MADDDLKIFISWSGELSKSVTRLIRAWLPKMFDRIDPWMSDIDIQAGTRGLQLIEERLNASEFGIIVVTTENQNKTWLNFEAGALSKRFEGASGRVVPVLVNFDNFYQIEGPIRQFQSVMLDKDGIRELLQSISSIAAVDWPMVEARFEWSWEGFDKSIRAAVEAVGDQPPAPEIKEADILQDILRRLKSMEKNASNDGGPRKDAPAVRVPLGTIANQHNDTVSDILRSNNFDLDHTRWSRRRNSVPIVTAVIAEPFDTEDLLSAIDEVAALGVVLRVVDKDSLEDD